MKEEEETFLIFFLKVDLRVQRVAHTFISMYQEKLVHFSHRSGAWSHEASDGLLISIPPSLSPFMTAFSNDAAMKSQDMVKEIQKDLRKLLDELPLDAWKFQKPKTASFKSGGSNSNF